jgi:hypothetical protein
MAARIEPGRQYYDNKIFTLPGKLSREDIRVSDMTILKKMLSTLSYCYLYEKT